MDEQGNPLSNRAYGNNEESRLPGLISVYDQQGSYGVWHARHTRDEKVWPEAGDPVQAHSAVFISKGSFFVHGGSGL